VTDYGLAVETLAKDGDDNAFSPRLIGVMT
jgi:hypothetical protein